MTLKILNILESKYTLGLSNNLKNMKFLSGEMISTAEHNFSLRIKKNLDRLALNASSRMGSSKWKKKILKIS
jgi:hypothetical protein